MVGSKISTCINEEHRTIHYLGKSLPQGSRTKKKTKQQIKKEKQNIKGEQKRNPLIQF